MPEICVIDILENTLIQLPLTTVTNDLAEKLLVGVHQLFEYIIVKKKNTVKGAAECSINLTPENKVTGLDWIPTLANKAAD